jgi:hypothetical protein
MLTWPQRPQPTIRIVGAIVLLAACTSSRPRREDGSAAPAAPDPWGAAAPGPSPARPGVAAVVDGVPVDETAPPSGGAAGAAQGLAVDATLADATPSATDAASESGLHPHLITASSNGVAQRCAIGGDPLKVDCAGTGPNLVLDADNRVYVVTGHAVRRLRRANAENCRYDPEGAPVELPERIERSQRLDGPLALRTGGVQWQLTGGAHAVYAYDFLGGVYRVDRGKGEKVCTDVFGFSSLAELGGRLLVQRTGVEQLVLGAHCTARNAGYDDRISGTLLVARDHLYVATTRGLARYDGRTRVELAPHRMLVDSVGLVPCGDGMCILDWSGMITQVTLDGAVERELVGFQMFRAVPDKLLGLAAERDGTLLVLARNRDSTPGGAICEAALYELPAKIFQR